MGNMVQQAAKIFLAGNRNKFESNQYRCFTTLIDAAWAREDNIQFFDETLAPGKSKFFTPENDTAIILIPLVGNIIYGNLEKGHSVKIAPEELQVASIKKGMSFSIKNPHQNNLANYLQIRIKIEVLDKKISFFDYGHNALNILFENTTAKLHFGVLDGRMEETLVLSNKNSSIIPFVINGAFEVQNRLLESRDSLALKNLDELEIEALSENAIILILEKNNTC
ncbi:hypothetical protein PY092_07775 [Muricauda sp. 334s03]|uniref:Quercetin 2,3-dioxygenase C-terminal cupin domain-containing protein n=1 Tax=Flagellimonas yonaguniensis TaxID=3031325 RepID=A0ABT5XXY2_9FLAO|nr:hypothetical protein [[Muricauda] yonaguniensis]MDF0716040.1 hypothetical protein [[Muricauda] yonaguniensis]